MGEAMSSNPALQEIGACHYAEDAQRKVEAAAKAVQDLAEKIRRKADQDREEAQLRQEEADRVAAQVAEEMVRIKAQLEEVANAMKRSPELAEEASIASMEEIRRKADQDREEAWLCQEEADRAAAQGAGEMMRMKAHMEEVANVMKRSPRLAEEAYKASKEDMERSAREAREERERAQKIRDEAQRAMDAAKEETQKAQQAADAQRRKAEAAKDLAQRMARTVAEETRKAREAKEDAERRLRDSIRPEVTPSAEELAAAKKRVHYREDCFHFAIAGISGSGKSSLVNAFRGLRNRDAGAAAVGVIQTTLTTTRYHDANPDNPHVWYDVPGAGTIKCSDWQYFNDQGLYVFDCIIVLFDNRFTATDLAILINARRFKIPTYIVRSKADQRIRNLMMEMGYDSEGDDEEDVDRRNKLYKAARKQFVDRTRKSVRDNLEDANLPNQRVYIISNTTLLAIVTGKAPRKAIDELELLNDLGNEAYARRKAKPV